MSFTEFNTVKQMILAAITQLGSTPASLVREEAPPYGGESLGDALPLVHWTYASYDQVPRQLTRSRIVLSRCSTRDRE